MAQIGSSPTRWQRLGPIVALLLLAPIVSEVLSGSTRLTTIFVLIPEIAIWGCGALLVRELVRRRGQGRVALLLLGLALSVAEEWVIQRTSLSPLPGLDPAHVYGRALGVNWVYFLWQLGFESVWVVLVPVQLVELMFPARRDAPWLNPAGLMISAVVFVLGGFAAWYSWTQVYVPQFYPQSVYTVPLAPVLIGLAAIAALVLAALGRRPSAAAEPSPRPAPRPWPVGLAAFGLALPWLLAILIVYAGLPALPPAIPLAAGVLLAGAALALLSRWAGSTGWQDAQRLALIAGALAAEMVSGVVVLTVTPAAGIDRVGQVVFSALGVVGLVWLSRSGPRAPRQG